MPSSGQVHLSLGNTKSPLANPNNNSSTAQVAAIILNAANAISTPHISKGIAFVDDDDNSISDVSYIYLSHILINT